jgi:hypothetical protein
LAFAWENHLNPMLMECCLGWAQVLEKQGERQTALTFVEAVSRQNDCVGLTLDKAERLQERLLAKMSSDEVEYARHCAMTMNLRDWAEGVLRPRKTISTGKRKKTRSRKDPLKRKKLVKKTRPKSRR